MELNEMAVTGFGEIAERLRRSTVLIRSGQPGRRNGSGSGVIWSDTGLIVSNAHVVSGSDASAQLWDGREFEAQVAERDQSRDLAALRISAQGLHSISIADSSRIRAGELALAIGNPLGFVGALSGGVVHGVGPVHGLGPFTWVQANVRLAPGNSGGPLANAAGEVIGINSMIAGGRALAIPSNTVNAFLESGATAAWLGVSVCPAWIPSSGKKLFGLVILDVQEGSPAANASLLPGDILLGAEDRRFADLGDLRHVLEGPGFRRARFEFLRGDYRHIRWVTVLLGRAGQSSRAQAA
jgi:serine protease Do